MGPDAAGAADPTCNAANDAWLVGKIDYDVVGAGTTGLWLQIGPTGLNNIGEASSENEVIFGAPADLPLNGETGRGIDSDTADAFIIAHGNATNFWLSEKGCPIGGNPGDCDGVGSPLGEVPTLTPEGDTTNNKIHIWGRPQEGKILKNLSLNVRAMNSGVINFTDVRLLNPLLMAGGPIINDTCRYEFVFDGDDGPFGKPSPDGQSINNVQAFTVANELVNGFGIGPASTTFDPFYDAVNDAWQMGTVTYDVVGSGKTDLFLQIGDAGINNDGESSSDMDVIFGHPDDPPLNGEFDRSMDSARADAMINAMITTPNLVVWLSEVGGSGEAVSVENPEIKKTVGAMDREVHIWMRPLTPLGVGIGPTGIDLGDPLYDAEADAWLFATATYDVTGIGVSDLFLQIGQSGILGTANSSSEIEVQFGAGEDPPLNAESQRQQDSLTADGTITAFLPLLGDMGCDQDVDFDDIKWFVLALNNATAYFERFGVTPELKGDIDGSGFHDFDDIQGFVEILRGPNESGLQAIPEASTLVLIVLGLICCLGVNSRKTRRNAES